jgi:hypothetical protein
MSLDKDTLWFKLEAVSQVEDKTALLTEKEIADVEVLLPVDCSAYDPREVLLVTAKMFIVIKADGSGENVDITRYRRDRKIRKIVKKFKVVKHPDNKSYWQRYNITLLSIVFEDGEVLEIKQPEPHFMQDFQKLIAILEQEI